MISVEAGLIFLQRRLQLLQAGVNKVAKGDLETSVQVVGSDDIARLSSAFNSMTKHIKRLIQSQRELTRAVSHELRTPVARIRFMRICRLMMTTMSHAKAKKITSMKILSRLMI